MRWVSRARSRTRSFSCTGERFGKADRHRSCSPGRKPPNSSSSFRASCSRCNAGLPLVFPPEDAKLFLTTPDGVLTARYRACTVVAPTPHLLEFLADADPDRVLINGTGGNHGKRHGRTPPAFGAI